MSINSHTFVADSDQQAADQYFPAYAAMMTRIGRERGWAPMTRPAFDAMREPEGSLVLGHPETVAAKILAQHEYFGHERFLAQMSVGPMPHDQVMHAIELFGTKVAPLVREELAPRQAAPATG